MLKKNNRATPTIGSMLEKHKGVSYGFDFLRVMLALGVLFLHSFAIVTIKNQSFSPGLIGGSIVPMFFSLSGFLITSSAMRLRLKDFLLNRAARILPALTIDVLVTALIIGPIFTILPLKTYFSSHGFFSYFENIIVLIHYNLPGVFTHNPYDATVNRSLWTLPFELGSYFFVSTCIILGLFHKKWLALCALFILAVLIASQGFGLQLPENKGIIVATLRDNFFSEAGQMLYVYFLAGSACYLFRNDIPYSPILFAVIVGLFLFCGFVGMGPLPLTLQKLIAVPFVVYIMAFIGVSAMPRLPIFHKGDYSYGIYLHGFPVQQAIIAVTLPYIWSPWVHYAVSVVLVTLVAMASWNGVEKPILQIRRKFSFTAHNSAYLTFY